MSQFLRVIRIQLTAAMSASWERASDYVDAFGHKQLTGTASYLANVIHQ